jgi:Ca-activated chloride channel family protein
MNREQAERLLAALIFDDLDETSKAELMAYLQIDDELRDRLADLRMAVKLADDAVNEGPDPVLNERRLKQLKRLAKADKARVRVFPIRRLLAVAAVLVFAFVSVGLLMLRMGVRSPAGLRLADVGKQYWMDHPPEQNRATAGSSAGRSVPPMVAPVPAAPRSASPGTTVLRRRIDPAVQPQQYGMGDTAASAKNGYVGGMASGRKGDTGAVSIMSGGGIANSTYDGRVANSDVEARKELLNQPLAQSRRELNIAQGRLRGELRYPSPWEALADPATKSLRGGSAAREQEREVAKEIHGDVDGDGIRLNEELGKKLAGAGTNELRGQASSSRGGRGNAPAETPTKADGIANYNVVVSAGWSGNIPPEKPAVPMATPAPSDSDVAFDKEVGQRLGINGSVKDNKSVPVLGDMPVTGELFRTPTSESKTNSEGLSGERGREENAPSRPLVQTAPAPVERGPEPAAQVGQVVAEDVSGLPVQSHFKVVPVNPWVMTERDAFSTFGLDVDTASYTLCRRYIRGGFLPPVGAVRVEEFINAFDYAYPQRDDATFAVHAEGAPSPFAPAGQDLVLLKIAVKARTVGRDQRRAANLIFVVDASASMGQADRLPLVQAVSNRLVDKLSEADRVSLVTCANEARLHLEAVSARQKDAIHQTINAIQPAGPTNLLAGLKLGYEMARKSFVAGQTNQVVLCSDGVANVGQTEAEAMLKEVAKDRKQAITLTCVGVGYGAYNDAFLEALADQGDGRYVFLDSSEQAQEALVEQLAGSLQNVATDARIQVQFDPAQVRRYRLIGYENRDIEDQRFRDDTVEAGAVGSGQCSTALYELELTGTQSGESEADLGTVFVRYRNTETGQIEEISRPLANSLIRRRSVEDDPRFFLAAGAARFAEWLRQSEHARQTSLSDVQRLLDRVSAALPLDRQVRDLATLAHQAEGLPRTPQAATEPASQP